MNDPQQDIDREQIAHKYVEDCEPPVDHHANYGDANPEAHGGVWITYDPDHREWEVYVTTHAAVYSDDAGEEDYGDQFVKRASIQFRDVITEDGEWTDRMESLLSELHRDVHSPMGAVVDDQLTALVAFHGDDHAHQIPYRDPRHQKESYDALLASLGIEPADDE
jgi:hypothetical protein